MNARRLYNWLDAQWTGEGEQAVMISMNGKLIPLLAAKVMTAGGGAVATEEVFVLYPEPVQEDVEYYTADPRD